MNVLADWLQPPQVIRFGWTLVHFVWQGALLAGAWALIRLSLKRSSPHARYLAGCLVLLLMVTAPFLTWRHLQPPSPSAVLALTSTERLSAVATTIGPASIGVAQTSTGGLPGAWVDWLDREADAIMPWLVGVWFTGVLVLSLRLAAGWQRVNQLRRRGAAVDETWLLARFEALRTRIGLSRPVRLLKSAWVEVPTVAGWLRPVILLPCSSLTGLSPRQLELLVAHELAHIRRHDPWVNLVQVLMETLLFYHPAVWWVSRTVREERESCCDDLAVAVCGDRMAYVDALASMEELRQLTSNLVLGAGGGSLLRRVRRLVGLGPDEADWRRAAGGTLLLASLLASLLAVAGWALSPKRYEAVATLRADPNVSDPLRGRTDGATRKPSTMCWKQRPTARRPCSIASSSG